MKKYLFFCLWLVLGSNVAKSQINLIQNGDFENLEVSYSDALPFSYICPIGWTLINTVDIYSKTDSTSEGICNKNFQSPQSGNNYIGLSNYNFLNPNYREHILFKFDQKISGKGKFAISFQYKFSKESSFFCDHFNLFFITSLDSLHKYIFYSNQSIDSTSLKLKNDDGDRWLSFQDSIFVNSNDFLYFGIGNLIRSDKKLSVKRRKKNVDCADSYFFFDDISLIALDSKETVLPHKIETKKINNNQKSFFSVRFEYGSSQILDEYNDSLKLLADTLKNSPVKVILVGYTDSIGSSVFNQNLSQMRANKISSILIKSGVDKNKITIDYNGENSPIEPNETENQRSVNRRVEIILFSEF